MGWENSVTIAQSVEFLRTGPFGYPIPVEVTFSSIVHTDPGVKPASCTMGNRSLSRGKRPGCGLEHPPPRGPTLQKGNSEPVGG